MGLLQLMLVLCITYQFSPADGYSRGAPNNACSNLTPRHGPGPQTSPAPFSVTPIQTNVVPGGAITLRIKATQNGESFKGFMVQATALSNQQNNGIGRFINAPQGAQLLSCVSGLENSITHGDSRLKTTLDVTWQAPLDFEGDIEFKATFVKDYSTFWTGVVGSERVRVGRSTSPPSVYSETPEFPNSIYYTSISTTTPSTTSATTTTTATTAATAAATTTTTTTTTAATTAATTTTTAAAVTTTTAAAVTTTTAATTAAATTTTAATTTPSVATKPWSFTTEAPPPTALPQLPSIYQGCGDLKGCFGLFDNCVEQGTCAALVTYSVKGLRYEFELWATSVSTNSYVAVAFSSDNKMGDDSVTECVMVNGRADVHVSFNDGKSNSRLRESKEGLSNIEAKAIDGNLYCKFSRESSFTVNNIDFDLKNSHHLLLSLGSATESGLGYHERRKAASAQSLSFAEIGAVAASKDSLVKVHGALMVAAWLIAGSMGITIARYFRQTWVGKTIMGKDLWFVFHRVLMVITWSLTVASFVIIFVELDGWTSVPVYKNPHAVIGCFATGLTFIQPFMASLRPDPDSPKRFIFNWTHWLVGNIAHTLATTCIFLAVDLDKASIPKWVNWLLVTYVVIHAITHIVLSMVQHCRSGGSHSSTVFAMRDMSPHQPNGNPYYSQQNKSEDANGSKFRKTLLTIYVVLVASVGAAVIGIIVTGPWY